jgi:hypothetical protein
MRATLLSLLFIVASMGCGAASVSASNKATFAPAPAAPVDLSYRVSEQAAAGQPVTFTATLNTGIQSGDLQLKVTKQVGVTLIGDTVRHIDLATATRPVELTLTVIPSDQMQRSLVVVVTVDVGGEPQSRSFRLSLPENNSSQQ